MSLSPKAQRCIDFTIRMEGDGKADGAGARFGIDPRYNPDMDVPNLTRAQAVDFYHDRYWVKYRLEEHDEALALVMLDYFVNSGAGPARFSRISDPTPLNVLRDRAHYMAELAGGFVSRDREKVAYWTASLPGWMRRIRANLDAVMALEAKGV